MFSDLSSYNSNTIHVNIVASDHRQTSHHIKRKSSLQTISLLRNLQKSTNFVEANRGAFRQKEMT